MLTSQWTQGSPTSDEFGTTAYFSKPNEQELLQNLKQIPRINCSQRLKKR